MSMPSLLRASRTLWPNRYPFHILLFSSVDGPGCKYSISAERVVCDSTTLSAVLPISDACVESLQGHLRFSAEI